MHFQLMAGLKQPTSPAVGQAGQNKPSTGSLAPLYHVISAAIYEGVGRLILHHRSDHPIEDRSHFGDVSALRFSRLTLLSRCQNQTAGYP